VKALSAGPLLAAPPAREVGLHYRTPVFGVTMRKHQIRAYYRALSVRSRAVWAALFVALLWVAFLALSIFTFIPLAMLDAAVVVVATVITFGAFYLAVDSMKIGLLQMEQADEHYSADKMLTDAIDELTNELRRRPQISSPVTFSLFGSPSKSPIEP
jgi:hypothetical protein